MRQYETFELRFRGEKLTDSWADVPVTAVFTCGEETKTVKGFYDGDGEYVVRFLPEKTGTYRWTVSGAVSGEGEEICGAAAGQHGIVKAVGTHFEFEDGTLFYPFGTTVYALAHQDEALTEQTLATLKKAPFNKVRMCVFPKHYDYNHNEPPCYAFEKNEDGSWDVNRPCIAFWQRLEKIICRMGEMGIQVDLILFHPYDNWGFSTLARKDNLTYLDYLLRRFAAIPGIWWSMANEYDLCPAKTLADWEEIECFLAENDPYGHPLSNHNCIAFWDQKRPNITHASFQTKILPEIPFWIRKYKKPVMIDECCYEGDIPMFWGSISGREMVNRFWRCVASGAYCTHGETFLDENEVLWWAKGGVLKGESPERIAFLRKITEELPGPVEPRMTGWQSIALDGDEQIAEYAKEASGMWKPFMESMLRAKRRGRELAALCEHEWAGACGEDAFIWFNDLQCYRKQLLDLPEDRHYRVEWIDTWAMTRNVIAEDVSGKTEISLPGREGLAVLAVRIK